eukprot:g13613.t1
MGNENSRTHTHGLHFKAKCDKEAKGLEGLDGSLKHTACVVVEFDGLAFLNKKNAIIFRPKYTRVTAWGSSKDAKRIQFEFDKEATAIFKVDNAKVLERAMLLRLDVFHNEDKFAATTVVDPSNKFAEEVIFHITSQGLSVADATGRTPTRKFEFVMLSGWGTKNNYEIVLQTRDGSQYTFATPSVKQMLAKLDDVARMVARALKANGAPLRQSAIDVFHREDEVHETPLTLVRMIFNPFGENLLPKDCAIRCLDGHGVRILGVGTKKKITVKYESLASWTHDGASVTLTLTPEKGSKSFVLECNNEHDANTLIFNLEQSIHRYDSVKQKRRHTRGSVNVVHQAPNIPNSLAQIGKLKSRRLSGSDKTLKAQQQQAMSGQNLFSTLVADASDSKPSFQMSAQVGRHSELLGLNGLNESAQYLIVVENNSCVKLVDCGSDAMQTLHSWPLTSVTGWQAIDTAEFMLVVPQGKISFFVEDAEVLASVLEDACVEYAKKVKESRAASQVPPPPAPPRMQQQPQQPVQPLQETIAVVLPKGIKPGNKMKVKLADGTMKEFKVPAGAKAGQTIEFTVKAVL